MIDAIAAQVKKSISIVSNIRMSGPTSEFTISIRNPCNHNSKHQYTQTLQSQQQPSVYADPATTAATPHTHRKDEVLLA